VHEIAIMVLASGSGKGQRKIVFGVLLLIIIVLVVGWVRYARNAANKKKS
jgi:hypothetical protein